MTVQEAVNIIKRNYDKPDHDWGLYDDAENEIMRAIFEGYTLCKIIDVISDASDYAEGMKLAIILEEGE